MCEREQRGLLIAATAKITKKGSVWLVPSQSGNGRYTVSPDAESPHCTCPDHETRGCVCKHVYAVRYVMQREQNSDGSETITERLTVTATKRKTYPQRWTEYNKSQTNEKRLFLSLLHDLCRRIEEPPRTKTGRKPLLKSDSIFSACFKVYSLFSGRRFMSDLRDAHEAGYITRLPHFNGIFKALRDPELTPILREMIIETSRPLKAIEEDFAADSSGFTTSRFIRWFDHKYGVVRQQHEWVKVHIMTGVKTNCVTAVEIRDKDASDTKLLPELVETTAKNFTMREVSADKGYGSLNNCDVIGAVGATPFIAFKSSHTGSGGGLWQKMFHFFSYQREEFLKHYHKRSNVESTFSMIKAKFGDAIRSKSDTAMVNEVLCKLLCHNIVVLIHEMYELGINPSFGNIPVAECRPAS